MTLLILSRWIMVWAAWSGWWFREKSKSLKDASRKSQVEDKGSLALDRFQSQFVNIFYALRRIAFSLLHINSSKRQKTQPLPIEHKTSETSRKSAQQNLLLLRGALRKSVSEPIDWMILTCFASPTTHSSSPLPPNPWSCICQSLTSLLTHIESSHSP